MRKDVVFLDIDTQFDFMEEAGALAAPHAREIRPNLRRLTQAALAFGVPVIATEDAHAPDDPEFADFSPHCVAGTAGAEKIEETRLPDAVRVRHDQPIPGGPQNALCRGRVVLEKVTTSPLSNRTADLLLDALPEAVCVVYGVATEYCVKNAAARLLERGRKVIVPTDAVTAISPEEGKSALEALRRDGATLTSTDEVLAALERGDVGGLVAS